MVILVTDLRAHAKRHLQELLSCDLVEEEDSPQCLAPITVTEEGEEHTRGVFEFRFRDTTGEMSGTLRVRTLSPKNHEVLTETLLRDMVPQQVRCKTIIVRQGKATRGEVYANIFDTDRVEFGCLTGGFPSHFEHWPDQ